MGSYRHVTQLEMSDDEQSGYIDKYGVGVDRYSFFRADTDFSATF